MKLRFVFLPFFLLFAFSLPCKATIHLKNSGKDSLDYNDKKRVRINRLATGFTIAYSGSLYLLYNAWYSKETKSSFHFHNDYKQWNKLDKGGHLLTAFHESRAGVDALKWAGLTDKQSIFAGGMLGIVLQTPVEIFDGFSNAYGASFSDMGANILGSAALMAQYLAWNETRITPKFSFHTTSFAALRPQLLGNSLGEQILKDYNGQSYWISFDISSFIVNRSYPKWLNIATGYGASGMVYGSPSHNEANGYASYKRFFLSPDINLKHIKTNSKILKKLFYVLDVFRIPMPAIEWNTRKQLVFHPLYF